MPAPASLVAIADALTGVSPRNVVVFISESIPARAMYFGVRSTKFGPRRRLWTDRRVEDDHHMRETEHRDDPPAARTVSRWCGFGGHRCRSPLLTSVRVVERSWIRASRRVRYRLDVSELD